jgi:hypothetical protein
VLTPAAQEAGRYMSARSWSHSVCPRGRWQADRFEPSAGSSVISSCRRSSIRHEDAWLRQCSGMTPERGIGHVNQSDDVEKRASWLFRLHCDSCCSDLPRRSSLRLDRRRLQQGVALVGRHAHHLAGGAGALPDAAAQATAACCDELAALRSSLSSPRIEDSWLRQCSGMTPELHVRLERRWLERRVRMKTFG